VAVRSQLAISGDSVHQAVTAQMSTPRVARSPSSAQSVAIAAMRQPPHLAPEPGFRATSCTVRGASRRHPRRASGDEVGFTRWSGTTPATRKAATEVSWAIALPPRSPARYRVEANIPCRASEVWCLRDTAVKETRSVRFCSALHRPTGTLAASKEPTGPGSLPAKARRQSRVRRQDIATLAVQHCRSSRLPAAWRRAPSPPRCSAAIDHGGEAGPSPGPRDEQARRVSPRSYLADASPLVDQSVIVHAVAAEVHGQVG
jgi:hypothetical protein